MKNRRTKLIDITILTKYVRPHLMEKLWASMKKRLDMKIVKKDIIHDKCNSAFSLCQILAAQPQRSRKKLLSIQFRLSSWTSISPIHLEVS